MKLFGAGASEIGTVLALENAAFFVFLSRLNFIVEAWYSLHEVQFFCARETHSMMAFGDSRAKSCQLDCQNVRSPRAQTIGMARFGI